MNYKEIVKDTYNDIAEKYFDAYYDDMGDKPFYDKFENLLKPNAKILDLGCGNGKICRYFAEKGYNTLGLDFSEEMLRLARKNSPNLEFENQDISEFNFEQKFDGAIYAYSLFHLNKEQGESSIKCVAKCLNKNSPLLLLLQNGEGEVIEPEPFNPTKQMYCKLYTKEEITSLLNKYGFDILEIIIFAEEEETALADSTMCVIAIKR